MKEDIIKVEEQIYKKRKTVRYDIRDLTVEGICNKFDYTIDENTDLGDIIDVKYNTIFIPEYQRDFTWDKKRQSKLVESIILGLPIPFIFIAENKNSTWEIVDGSQRIRTINSFVNDHLELVGLQNLNTLNGYKFTELDKTRQGKFLNTALRLIILEEATTEEVKKDMFERINRGSDLLKPMEQRKGLSKGPFVNFIYDYCKSNKKFIDMVPVDKWLVKRQEHEELLLRFFALSEDWRYSKGVDSGITNFLDSYLNRKNSEMSKLSQQQLKTELQKYENKINRVLDFVEKYFPYGFRAQSNPQTKRSIFEAISVGVCKVIEQKAKLKDHITKDYIKEQLHSQEFRKYAYVANELHRKKKLAGRIDYIFSMLTRD